MKRTLGIVNRIRILRAAVLLLPLADATIDRWVREFDVILSIARRGGRGATTLAFSTKDRNVAESRLRKPKRKAKRGKG